MDFKEEIFGYLVEIEDLLTAEFIREAEVEEILEDLIILEFEAWAVCSFYISIKAKYFKSLDTEYICQKNNIEDLLIKFAQSDKTSVRYISWLPLRRIKTEISKYNQNDRMKQMLIDGDYDMFFNHIKSILATLSYDIKITEGYFHSNIHILLKTLGFTIVSEEQTNIGRIDSVIELDAKIIIIEFKTSNADIALAQIKEKKYYEKFIAKGKNIFLIGVGCNLSEKNIRDWKVEQLAN